MALWVRLYFMITLSNGTISALLALLRGIHRSPVDSPHNGQWRRALMFFFYLRLNKRLSKQWRPRWFETPSRSLWRHCNVPCHPQGVIASTYSTMLKSTDDIIRKYLFISPKISARQGLNYYHKIATRLHVWWNISTKYIGEIHC